jgi:hypothetical protein
MAEIAAENAAESAAGSATAGMQATGTKTVTHAAMRQTDESGTAAGRGLTAVAGTAGNTRKTVGTNPGTGRGRGTGSGVTGQGQAINTTAAELIG